MEARFIHSERSKKLVRAVIEEAGFPPEETHYDLPKPRTSFPVGHQNTGFDEQLVAKLFGAPPADAMLVFGEPGQN